MVRRKNTKEPFSFNPSYATAPQWYAEFLASHKCFNEALASAKRAEQLDPLSPVIGVVAGNVFYFLHRYDEAIKQYRETLTMDPHFEHAHLALGKVYCLRSMYVEAIVEFQTAVRLQVGDPWAMALLGYAYAVSGNRAEALKILDELMLRSKSSYLPSFPVAALYVGLGDRDRAFEWLGKALEDRSDALVLHLPVDPILDPLRSDPRFSALLRRMKLNP